MITITAKHKVFLATHPIDFRKGIDGIKGLCEHQLQLDPFSGHLFIFRNKRANALRILCYDEQGFWLAHKRLSQGRFNHWPQSSWSVCEMTPTQLHVLVNNGNPQEVITADPFFDRAP